MAHMASSESSGHEDPDDGTHGTEAEPEDGNPQRCHSAGQDRPDEPPAPPREAHHDPGHSDKDGPREECPDDHSGQRDEHWHPDSQPAEHRTRCHGPDRPGGPTASPMASTMGRPTAAEQVADHPGGHDPSVLMGGLLARGCNQPLGGWELERDA